MKKIVFLLLGLISVAAHSQISRNYEAENAILTDSIKIKEDKTASNSKYLFFGKNGSVKWMVDNPSAGWFRISLRYRAIDGDVAQSMVINGKTYGMGFTMCNNWNDAFLKIYLQKGENEITLSPDYGNMDIDFLSIPEDSLFLLPVISPVQSVFYKDHPTAITIFADARGKILKSIRSATRQIDFKTNDFSYLEGACQITLAKESLMSLPTGISQLHFEFDDGSIVRFILNVKESVDYTGLTLVMFDVEHGNSVLALLPDGKRLLIDSGKETYAKSVVMPFLDYNHIDTIDYFIITHYHPDHTGAKDEIIQQYNVQHFFDYKSFKSGDTIQWGNTVLTILNAFADGTDENTRSLSFLLNWNGFTYSHGADVYAHSQNKMLEKFGAAVTADVFYANHHFHGSVNPDFITRTNPALVVVSAQQAVYARGAYADTYKEQTEKNLYSSHARLIETLLTLETGTIVVRVDESGNWCYETYRNCQDIYLPKTSD